MALDPTKHPDWQIAQDAEKSMKTVETLAAELGLEKDELLPYGHYMGKIEQQAVLRRLADRPNGKYVDVTAITPTPLGEGKSTTTIGLVQGLSKRGVKTTAAIRQPSGGPTMGMKGSAAGGGLAQCIPLTPYSLNFTGDIHAITSAHNLAMVALTSRMQHERVGMGWAMDFCCQALRNVIIGIEGDGRRNDGFMMRSRFDITAASEIMSIMSLARDLPDLRKRLSRVVLAFDRAGNPVTTADLEVDGAMMAWLLEASKPNLIQTIEGQPVLVHAGPFGNIALGQSSIIADRVALKLSDIHVTESGFGSEIGYEKFWNVKCHMSGLKPDAAVIVATVRALKMHGGLALDQLGNEDLAALERGLPNLLQHVGNIQDVYSLPVVVAINAFPTDTPAELALVEEKCAELGVNAVLSEHWAKGGAGAIDLAHAVVDACGTPSKMTYSYEIEGTSIEDKLDAVARKIYHADGVDFVENAPAQLKLLKEQGFGDLPVCVAKTQYSFSDDPTKLGAPRDFRISVRNLTVSAGAGFIVALTGDIMTMPGLSKVPSAEKIDVDSDGKITGLF